jgi:hypothetical protein
VTVSVCGYVSKRERECVYVCMCIFVFCICAEVDATHEPKSTTSGSSIGSGGRGGGLRPTPSNKLGATLKMPATSLSYSSYLLTWRREHAAGVVNMHEGGLTKCKSERCTEKKFRATSEAYLPSSEESEE